MGGHTQTQIPCTCKTFKDQIKRERDVKRVLKREGREGVVGWQRSLNSYKHSHTRTHANTHTHTKWKRRWGRKIEEVRVLKTDSKQRTNTHTHTHAHTHAQDRKGRRDLVRERDCWSAWLLLALGLLRNFMFRLSFFLSFISSFFLSLSQSDKLKSTRIFRAGQ